MNWYIEFTGSLASRPNGRFKKAQNDPLYNVKLMVGDAQNGLGAQLSAIKKLPLVTQHFHSSNLQDLFVKLTGAVTGIGRVLSFQNQQAVPTARQHVQTATALMRQICTTLASKTGTDISRTQQLQMFFGDLRDIGAELANVGGQQQQQPPSNVQNRQPAGVPQRAPANMQTAPTGG